MSGLTKPERVAILRERDGDDCWECCEAMDFTLPRDDLRAPTIDHDIPRAAGGTNALWNLHLMHRWPCNARKAAIYNDIDYSKEIACTSTSSVRTAAPVSIATRPVAATLSVRLGDLFSAEALRASLGWTSATEISQSDLAEAS
jgi:hypothetical protein